ncbi:tetratricopeptide repeat protein [Chloroflexota bacterium]
MVETRSKTSSPQQVRIKRGLRAAQRHLTDGNEVEALAIYRKILLVEADQEEATAQAVLVLARQGRFDTARKVLERSIQAGNQDAGAYVSVAELHLRSSTGDWGAFLAVLPMLPTVQPAHLLRGAWLYRQQGCLKECLDMLHAAERLAPTDQAVLMELAGVYQEIHHDQRAITYWQRVIDQDARSPLGQAAAEDLLELKPHIPRRIQSSSLFALREVAGVALVFFLLAMLDAGGSVTAMALTGWLGVGLSILGGYLLVTATSSPGQRIFAPFLVQPVAELPSTDSRDAYLPDMTAAEQLAVLPGDWRIVLGVVGLVLVVIAGVLVVPHSLLVTHETMQTLQQGDVPFYVQDWLAEVMEVWEASP